MKKWFVLFLATVFVSFSGIFVRLANVAGFVCAFYRILFALIVVVPAFIVKRKRSNIKDVAACILGGFIFGYELALWNMSVVLVNATVPTLLVNLSCIWIGVFSYFVLKEKVEITHWIGTSVALIGVVIIIGYSSLIGLKIEKGVLFAIICSIMISIYTLIVKRARKKMDSVCVLLYTLIGSMLALIIWALVGRVNLLPSSKQSWQYLIGLGVIVQGFGYLSINYALGYISSTKVTLTLLLQPVFTGLLAVFVMNERLKENQLLGSILVILGLVVSFIKISRSSKMLKIEINK